MGWKRKQFTIHKSFGLFESNIEDETDLTIAKWHIVVNDSDLNQTEIIRRQRVLAFLNAWNRISVPLMQESFASAGLGRERK